MHETSSVFTDGQIHYMAQEAGISCGHVSA